LIEEWLNIDIFIGLKIVQLSDIHLGPTIGLAFLEKIVDITLNLKPDLVVITGDLIDSHIDRIRPALAPLNKLSDTRNNKGTKDQNYKTYPLIS